MVVLASPVVIGPVLTTSPAVRVDGVVNTAFVEVVAAESGTVHAQGTAHSNGTLWLPVIEPLADGSTLIATQKSQNPPGPDSDRPVHGVPVLAPPASLPAPVFEAVLNQCSQNVLLSALVPGADVTIERGGGGVLATQNVDRTRQWITLTAPLHAGEALRARQSIPGLNPSADAISEPVAQVDVGHVDIPQVVGPITACQSEINFAGVTPTARVTVQFDDGTSNSWYAPGPAFRAALAGPLAGGGLRVRQLLPGCERRSDDGKVPIGPEQVPPDPDPRPFCPETQQITVGRLLAGATVTFTVVAWENGNWGPETSLMTAGAAGGWQNFNLPPGVGGGPGPVVAIRVRQTLCVLTSQPGQAGEYARPGESVTPSPRPQIVGPVFRCAQTVRIDPSGWGIGTLRSTRTGRQLADDFIPYGAPEILPLWFPLDPGDVIRAEYTGCNAPIPTDEVRVEDLPDPLPELKIATPLPGDTDLVTSGALPGAKVFARVGSQVRSSTISIDGSATLPLGPPLQEHDRVWAYQRLCGARSYVDRVIEVQRGTLAVSPAPETIVAGAVTAVVVTAARTDTGAAVGGLPVTLGGASVGVTGTAFALTSPATGNVTGVVSGGPRYTDASYTIAVTAPPPPPPPNGATLTLQLGGIGGYGSPITIAKMTWKVQPSWAAGPVSAGGTTATISLPPPPAGTPDPRALIYLQEFEATRTDGGTANKLWPDATAPMTTVALTKSALHVGFLLTTELRAVYDDSGNPQDYVWEAVIRWQGTV